MIWKKLDGLADVEIEEGKYCFQVR